MNKLEYLRIKSIIEKNFKKEQCFDEKTIYDIIEIIINHRKYKTMISDVNLISENAENRIGGAYSPIDKNIKIVLPHDQNNYFDYNTTVLHILLHELEHVGQYKKCLESKNSDLEKGLFDTCFKANNYLEQIQKKLHNNEINPNEYLLIIEQMKFYQMYSEIVNKECYELLPTERQAEINSFKYLIELLKNNYDEKYKDKFEMIKVNYLIRNLMGYKSDGKNVIAPTYELYRIILDFMNQSENKDKYFEKFDSFSKSMKLDQRLYYGLNISLDEYNNKKLEIGKHLIK